MNAFTPEYPTPEAYILGITERIWEGRGIGLIRQYYAPGVVMHTGSGEAAGVGAVVSGTLETLHAFPDRRLLGEDVIWADRPGGGYSSHRILSTMRHEGNGTFGPPTGRTVRARTIADCVVADGVITEEWLVRDQAGIAVQLGLDPAALGRSLAARPPSAPLPAASPAPIGDDAGGRCADLLHRIWNRAELQLIRESHDPAVDLHLPAARRDTGHDAAERFVIGYLAAFPGARVAVEHVITRTDPGRPTRVALRWRLDGTHAGHGTFGPPSGAVISVPCITHLELVGDQIVRAYVLIDELGIWSSIARG